MSLNLKINEASYILRKKSFMSQQQMAERIGISKIVYNLFEQGKLMAPAYKFIDKLAKPEDIEKTLDLKDKLLILSKRFGVKLLAKLAGTSPSVLYQYLSMLREVPESRREAFEKLGIDKSDWNYYEEIKVK